jgi:hypothetical protein
VLKKLASIVFLAVAIAIGLGAFGHGLAVRHVHAAIDQFPIEADMHSMLYVVWYFVSGCMFAFGLMSIWVWRRVRAGDPRPLAAAAVIGVLYLAIGAFGLVYRHGDPFMITFVVLGGLLLLSGYGMVRDAPRTRQSWWPL